MTQRDELTRAVVEAAREISEQRMTGEMSEAEQENADYEGAYNSLIELIRGPIRALSALDAQASAGEVVEVALWQSTEGLIWWCIPHSRWDEDGGGRDAIRLGVARLPLVVGEVKG